MLVAGTTGSGKSELLRSLVLGLALSHPPDQVSFLLVDFKGGSGLGVLGPLPHAAGLLTDLSAENVSRALISLRAEVRRRERLFAAAGASDLDSYRGGSAAAPGVPRLVVVIDEFRMLTEEVPEAMSELVRIAALGRSLGIHLVLATQRPQGAVSADIRANVTTSIALRVQSTMESHDVIGGPDAAAIRLDAPGRAYLKTGSLPATEFQSASAGLCPEGTAGRGAAVMPLDDYLLPGTASKASGGSPAGCRGRHAGQPPSYIPRLISAIGMACEQASRPGNGERHRPLLDPLPATLPALPEKAGIWDGSIGDGTEVDGKDVDGVVLGLLDLPDRQEQRILRWLPARDAHLAVLGTGAGPAGVLRLGIRGLIRASGSHHFYILDGDGQLKQFAGQPNVGAYAAAHELKLAVQILRRLGEEVMERLAGGDNHAAQRAVVVSGWGRWITAIRSSRWAWAEEVLLDITRDGAGAGITLLISGDRELLAGRFFAQIPNRIFLPAGCSPESLMAWPKLPPMDRIPGRALVQGRIGTDAGCVAQLLEPPGPAAPPDDPSMDDAVSLLSGVRASELQPFRIRPLPQIIHRSELVPERPDTAPDSASGLLDVPVGVSGDEPGTCWLRLQPGMVFPVLGGAGSGRTNFLRLVQASAPADVPVLMPAHGEDPRAYWNSVPASSRPLSGTGLGRTLLLVDDADRLPQDVQQQLGSLHAQGAAVVFAAVPGPTLMSRVPLSMQARSAGHGIILAPGQPADGDFLGIRLEVDYRCGPGRAFLVQAGQVTELQTALVTPADATA